MPRRGARRAALVLLVLAVVATAVPAQAAVRPVTDEGRAQDPASTTRVPARARTLPQAGDAIPGRFVVRLREDASPAAVAASHRGSGVRTRAVYSRVGGLTVEATPAALSRLRRDPRVAAVAPDRVVTASATQASPVWGLDRVDQRDLPLDGSYSYDDDGAGVTVFVLDTGIRTHDEFTGRLASGYDAIGDGTGTDDCHGHGTHVAGTAGGTTYGVAKGVTLVPVQVLDCYGRGTTSTIIAGLDWVAQHPARPAVANLSLGSEAHDVVDAAVRTAVAAGVTVVAAAGNDGNDACDTSPARAPEAITVGATTWSDVRATWSNYGSCVDLFAPGSGIVSAGISSPGASVGKSGTSMASPHVAGAAALHLAAHPAATPAEVQTALVGDATTGRVDSVGVGSPNRLLHIGDVPATPGPPPPNQKPTANASVWCARDACTYDASRASDTDGVVTGLVWTLPDGSTTTDPVMTHTFTASGRVGATVVVTDDDGATTTQTVEVVCRGDRRVVGGQLYCS